MRGNTLVRLVEYGHPLLVWQAAEQARGEHRDRQPGALFLEAGQTTEALNTVNLESRLMQHPAQPGLGELPPVSSRRPGAAGTQP
jgi:hypothetical protein